MKAWARCASSLVVTLVALGCGGSPSVPAAPAAATPIASASAAPSASASDAAPNARVIEVKITRDKDDLVYKRVKIVFANPSAQPCEFAGYKVVWGKASKTVQDRGFTVPPGETRERTLKVHSDDGNFDALTS